MRVKKLNLTAQDIAITLIALEALVAEKELLRGFARPETAETNARLVIKKLKDYLSDEDDQVHGLSK